MVCINQPDGVYEMNCKAFSRCVDGEELIVNCGEDQAFNRDTKECDR